MTDLPHVELSLSDQIVQELLDLLVSKPEFDGCALDALRLVAAHGRLSNEKDVTSAIKSVNEETDEAL